MNSRMYIQFCYASGTLNNLPADELISEECILEDDMIIDDMFIEEALIPPLALLLNSLPPASLAKTSRVFSFCDEGLGFWC
jgi:hypothetical protein